MEYMIVRGWRWLEARPRARDAAAAALYLLVGLGCIAAGAVRIWPQAEVISLRVLGSNTLGFALLLCIAVAVVALRSSAPISALLLILPVGVLDVLAGGSVGVVLIVFDLVYCAIKYADDRAVRAVMITAGVVAAVVLCALLLVRPRSSLPALLTFQWGFLLTTAMMWGWNVRSERLRTRAAMREVHARDIQRTRERIAHDLHDLVANQIAITGLHVEAARLRLGEDPDPRVARSLAQASTGAEQADRQLRRLIAILSAVDDLEELDPLPVPEELRSLADLLPGGRALEWEPGAEAAAIGALRAMDGRRARLTIRILRELMANAAKHGSGPVRVSVEGSTSPRIVVANAVGGTATSRGSGVGIAGAQLLLDGTGMRLSSGPRGPVWRAELTLSAGTDSRRSLSSRSRTGSARGTA